MSTANIAPVRTNGDPIAHAIRTVLHARDWVTVNVAGDELLWRLRWCVCGSSRIYKFGLCAPCAIEAQRSRQPRRLR